MHHPNHPQPQPPAPAKRSPAGLIIAAAVIIPITFFMGVACGTAITALPDVDDTPAAAADADEPAAEEEPTPAKRTARPKPKPKKPTYGPGTYLVGEDIKPGTYRTKGVEGFTCYWARLKDTSGDFGSIVANGTTDGPATVTIKRSDGAFKTSGCKPWTRR